DLRPVAPPASAAPGAVQREAAGPAARTPAPVPRVPQRLEGVGHRLRHHPRAPEDEEGDPPRGQRQVVGPLPGDDADDHRTGRQLLLHLHQPPAGLSGPHGTGGRTFLVGQLHGVGLPSGHHGPDAGKPGDPGEPVNRGRPGGGRHGVHLAEDSRGSGRLRLALLLALLVLALLLLAVLLSVLPPVPVLLSLLLLPPLLSLPLLRALPLPLDPEIENRMKRVLLRAERVGGRVPPCSGLLKSFG